ncbi:MAG TPA: uroporphyrinogen decarboxylase family protein [Fimbriimonas sp.]
MLPHREPDFSQMLRVLNKQRPDRPVMFEFLVDGAHLKAILGSEWAEGDGVDELLHNWVRGFAACGYDFSTMPVWGLDLLEFPGKNRTREKSVGMAHGGMIHDRATLEAYPWPDTSNYDYSILDRVARHLRPNQKVIIHGPGGVLENATELAGYEELCFLIADEPDAAEELFDRIGRLLWKHYDLLLDHPCIGGAFVNDDWGFKTQPFLPPDLMRKYVFPWNRRIIERIHQSGKPAILHSCGNLDTLWDDILCDLKIDAKHSYEDEIHPVEEVYEQFVGKMAVMGGIDVDFLCRSTPAQIADRCRKMLERTASRGGYALGSGNSIPNYVPLESYLAMQRVGFEG